MATNFAAAALGAEGLAADVRMLVGNGYVPGHADLALSLLREVPAVRALFESRLDAESGRARRARRPATHRAVISLAGMTGGGSQLLGVLPGGTGEGSDR